MLTRKQMKLLWGLIATLALGCAGQGGDGAGSIIVGQPIGGSGENQALPYARVSLNARDIFAVSDASGEYNIPGVPNGTYTLRVAKWNTPLLTTPVTIAPGSQPNVDLGLHQGAATLHTVTLTWPTLSAGNLSLGGRVLDKDGNGINEVEVLVVYPSGAFARTVTSFNTDTPPAAGYFTLHNLPANPVRLIIGQDGLRPDVVETPFDVLTPVTDGFNTGDVTLLPIVDPASAAMPQVIVRDSSNKLLPGIPVAISLIEPGKDPIDRFGIGGVTGADGSWTFVGVPGGHSYQIWAGSGDYLPETTMVDLAAGESRTITLTLTKATGQVHPYLAPTR